MSVLHPDTAPDCFLTQSLDSGHLVDGNDNPYRNDGDPMSTEGDELPSDLCSTALRLLHNMNSLLDSLPSAYYVKHVVIDSNAFARGGEAVIRRGQMNGVLVAVRQFFSLDSLDEQAERALLRVCSFI